LYALNQTPARLDQWSILSGNPAVCYRSRR
jgi:hypothetical protein